MKLANEAAQRTIGRRRLVPRWPVSEGVRTRTRYPFTKKRVLHLDGRANPKTLQHELAMTDKRPALWVVGLMAIAVVPQLSGSTRFLTVVTTFAILPR